MSSFARHEVVATVALVAAIALGPSRAGARLGDCGQPLGDGARPDVTDCLAILRAAVGITPCFRDCVCAVRGRSYVTAIDAQACLQMTTGGEVEAACDCGPSEPMALGRVTVEMTLRWSIYFPPRLHLLLALSKNGSGELGVFEVEAEYMYQSSVWPIQWRHEGDAIRIDGGRAEVWTDAELYWSPFVVTLSPPTQDGAVRSIDAGTLEYARFDVLEGDVVFAGEIYDEPLVVEEDAESPTLRFFPTIRLAEPFVGDVFVVRSTEPVARDELEARVRLLANGAPFAATATPRNTAGRFATALTFAPTDYLPFQAELALDTGGLTDLVGHEATWDGDAWTTMADPGPASANPDFELLDPYSGYGWSGARLGYDYDPSRPWLVDRQASLLTDEFDRMLGYFDLAQDAASLRFSAGVDGGCLEEYCLDGVHVYLLTPGARRDAFIPDFEPVPDTDWGSCYSNVYSIPEHRVHVDVADLVGQRVFVYAHAFWNWPCDYYTLTLDDFRIVPTAGLSTTTTTSSSTTTTTFACTGAEGIEIDFTDDATGTVNEVRESGVTVTGSAELYLLHLNGVAVVGGYADTLIDGSESIRFAFDRPALDAASRVTAASNLNLDSIVGACVVEAFGADGASIGSWSLSDPSWIELRDLAGCTPISAFTVTAVEDGLRIGAVRYRDAAEP